MNDGLSLFTQTCVNAQGTNYLEAVAQPGGSVAPPPKYLCNYGPLQVKGPLWEKNGHFVLGASTGIGAPRVKGTKEVAPSKGPLQIKGPYTDKGPPRSRSSYIPL